MLFYELFQSLAEKGAVVTVELKNDAVIRGVLVSTDQFLNIRLSNLQVIDEANIPFLKRMKNCFVRGSSVRSIVLDNDSVDCEKLAMETRRKVKEEQAAAT